MAIKPALTLLDADECDASLRKAIERTTDHLDDEHDFAHGRPLLDVFTEKLRVIGYNVRNNDPDFGFRGFALPGVMSQSDLPEFVVLPAEFYGSARALYPADEFSYLSLATRFMRYARLYQEIALMVNKNGSEEWNETY